MAKTSCAKALQLWEQEHQGEQPSESEEIKLCFLNPPIDKMDPPVLNTLAKVKRLSLSTNAIEKMVNLPGLRQIEILSLSRNQIKKISGLEEIGQTLKELWISHNFIEKLDGLTPCIKLHTLYISNNKIKIWDEIDKLKDLPEIGTVLFVGNPIYDNVKEDPKLLVLKRLGTLKNVDGTVVDDTLLEKVKNLQEGVAATTIIYILADDVIITSYWLFAIEFMDNLTMQMQKPDSEKILIKYQGILEDNEGKRFKLLKKLGGGTFGQVFSAVDTKNKKQVAIKFMKKDPRKIILCQYLDMEAEHMHSLRKSKYVVYLYTCIKAPNIVILVMEEMKTDLNKVFQSFKRLSEEICEIILQQMLNALFELRSLQIIHRDIKPSNIGINLSVQDLQDFHQRSCELQCKLLDFGLSKNLSSQKESTSQVGTPGYMAPEVQNQDFYSYDIDIYSLGVTMLQLVTGIMPNAKEFDTVDNFNKIKNLQLRTFIQSMMDIKAAKRPNWDEILRHPQYFSKQEISTGVDIQENLITLMNTTPFDMNKLKLERQRYILFRNTAVKLQELKRELQDTQFTYFSMNSQITKYIEYLMRNARMFNEQLSETIVQDQSQEINQLRKKINKDFQVWFQHFKVIKEKPNIFIQKLFQSRLPCVHVNNPDFRVSFFKTNQDNYKIIQRIINDICYKDKDYTPEYKLNCMKIINLLTILLIYLAFCKGSIDNISTVHTLEKELDKQIDPFSALTNVLAQLNLTYN